MKVAVTAQGAGPESKLDPRFGRASCFVVFDSETGEYECVDNNQNLTLAQGAGIQAAQNVAATGAKAVVSGHVGPKAYMVLDKGGVDIYLGGAGTVAEAFEAFKAGTLERANGPDKNGHW